MHDLTSASTSDPHADPSAAPSAELANDLRTITTQTLAYYEQRAEAFREGTRDHDVRQNIDALLTQIRGAPPFTILDFGCGPGRDLKTFSALGHEAVGLEGAPTFAAMARTDSGCTIWTQDFLALDLPTQHFDGIFANASLQHVPSPALPRVLAQLFATLKPDGVLFSSIPRGNNEAGWNNGRYSAFHDLNTWSAFLHAAGFTAVQVYYRPAGLPRAQQPWLASVWRKAAPLK